MASWMPLERREGGRFPIVMHKTQLCNPRQVAFQMYEFSALNNMPHKPLIERNRRALYKPEKRATTVPRIHAPATA